MRLLILASIFILFGGIVFAGCGCAKAVDVGSSIGPDYGDGVGQGIKNQTQTMNQTQEQEQEKNQTQEHLLNQTQTMNQTQEQEGEGDGKGISEQVHQIIEARKNGTIDVPQGMLVRIVAHNRVMNFGNLTQITLNETLRANVKLQGKNRTLVLEPDTDTINITDENVTVQTNETLEIENETLSVAGKKVLIMPSVVPEKIKTKTIKSAVLHVANGDPLYSVNATRKAKVLWIFDAEMDVEIDLDANSGNIKNEKRPWWSFLASVQEEG